MTVVVVHKGGGGNGGVGTNISKAFFAHFGQFSKHLSYFKHSYLCQLENIKLKPIY